MSSHGAGGQSGGSACPPFLEGMVRPQTDILIFAVVAITSIIVLAITGLQIWHPGDNAGAITAILGIATPAVTVLIVLLQGQRTVAKVNEVAQQAQETAQETRQVARRVEVTRQVTLATVVEAAQKTAAKVEEIHDMVNGQRDELLHRIAALEHELSLARRKGGAS